METTDKTRSKYLYAALIITILSFVYWAIFSSNAYRTFNEFLDLGWFNWNMYYDLHYLNLANVFQILIFGDHIAPDQVLVLLVYWLHQMPLTLLFIQAAVLSFTGLAIFLISRNLINDDRIAFVLFIAFLLNPGMRAMLTWGYHTEAFITLFYLLTFYYYMKLKKPQFLASLVLLLGTVEISTVLVIFLGLGLVLYELRRDKDPNVRKRRLKFCFVMIALALLAIGVYNIIFYSLQASYLSKAYAGMPPDLKVISYPLIPIIHNATTFDLKQSAFTNAVSTVSKLRTEVAYALIVGLFGFGISVIFDAPSLLLLSLPWLVELLLIDPASFASITYQYFGFVLGPSLVATLLGMQHLVRNKSLFGKKLSRMQTLSILAYSCIVVIVITNGLWPIFWANGNMNEIAQRMLFVSTQSQKITDAQLNSIITQIPKNASLIAQSFVFSQVSNREYPILMNWYPYVMPEYIIVDNNTRASYVEFNENSSMTNVASDLSNNTYTLIAANGSVELYKYKGAG